MKSPPFKQLIEFSIDERHLAPKDKERFGPQPIGLRSVDVCDACGHSWTFHAGRMDEKGMVWRVNPGVIGYGIPPSCIEPMQLDELMEMVRGERPTRKASFSKLAVRIKPAQQ